MDDTPKAPSLGWQFLHTLAYVAITIFIFISIFELIEYCIHHDSILRHKFKEIGFDSGSLTFSAWLSLKRYSLMMFAASLMVLIAGKLNQRLRTTN